MNSDVLLPVSRFRRGIPLMVQQFWLNKPPKPSDGLLKTTFPSLSYRLERKHYPTNYVHINQFLTGHGPFRKNILKYRNSLDCYCGIGIHDARHVLYECPLVNRQRTLIEQVIGGNMNGFTSWLANNGHNSKRKSTMSKINQLLYRMQKKCPPSNDDLPP